MGGKYKTCRNKRYKTKRITNYRSSADIQSIDISEYKFEIKEECMHDLLSHRQMSGSEFCGIIMGSTVGCKSYRINYISQPCNTEYNNSYKCCRDATIANQLISEEYTKSNKTRVYFGEWHTHPESTPIPSSVDIDSIRDIYEKSVLPIDGVFLCIIGQQDIYWGFYIFNHLHAINPIVI